MQLTATVALDQATIDTAKVNLAFTDIRAPIDGRTGQRLVDVGNMVQANQAVPLVNITQHQADLRELHRAAGRHRRDPARPGARRRSTVLAFADDDKTQLVAGQADPDRQPDRPGNRHDASQGHVRERRRAAVAGRVRQCAPGDRHAHRRRHRSRARDHAGSRRLLRLHGQVRQHRATAPRRSRRHAGRPRRHHPGHCQRRQGRRRRPVPALRRVARQDRHRRLRPLRRRATGKTG